MLVVDHHLSMTEGFIGVRATRGLVVVDRRRGRVRGVVVRDRLGLAVRAQSLVGVGSLFGHDSAIAVAVVVRGATGAAAGADDPEESGSEREGDREPGGDVDVLAHLTLDTVLLEIGLEDALEDGEHGGGSDGSGSGEEESNSRHQAGHAATPATADSKDTDDQLDDGESEGDYVGDEHPLGNGLVGVQGALDVAGKGILQTGLFQVPDLHRVEPELGLGLGAVAGLIAVVGSDVSFTVAPETNGIEVLDIVLFLDFLERSGEIAIRNTGQVTHDGGYC